MALAQLVVALCLLALSLGNKDMKRDFKKGSVLKNPTPQVLTGQQSGESGEQHHNRFVRSAFNSPTDEFKTISFSPDVEQQNLRDSLKFFARRSPEKLIAKDPPLDKVGGGFFTRELSEPEFEGLDSGKGEALGIDKEYPLQHGFMSSYRTLKDIQQKGSETQVVPQMSNEDMLVKRLDKIDKTAFRPANFGGNGRYRKNTFRNTWRNSGSGFNSREKKYLDEINRSGFSTFEKRNFDEIDRSGFHSLGKRNLDVVKTAGLQNLLKRNFDEIDRAGFHSLGRRNFDEIDKSGFRDFGKRDFDEIDRSGFRDFGKRNIDGIDGSLIPEFGKLSSLESNAHGSPGTIVKDSERDYKDQNNELKKRNFDEIDRSGFRSFSKRSVVGEKSKNSA